METVSNGDILAKVIVVITEKFNWFGLRYQFICSLKEGENDHLSKEIKNYLSKIFFVDCKREEFRQKEEGDEINIDIYQNPLSDGKIFFLTH